MYRVTKVISAALLAFIIVTAVTVGLGSMADDGVILDAWYAMIGYIPFGNVLAPLCVDLFSESFNLGKNMSEYLIGKSTYHAGFFSGCCNIAADRSVL